MDRSHSGDPPGHEAPAPRRLALYEKTPYQEGYDAYDALDENPYPNGAAAAEQWKAGWWRAYEENEI